MNVHLYERIWMWAATGMLAVFLAVVVLTALIAAVHPPSHLETIDPATVTTTSEFAVPGVTAAADGSLRVLVVAEMYRFVPSVIEVPAGRRITFRVTSPDVMHGFQIVGTNTNVMVAPGYVSEVTTSFTGPGDYLIVCNEYCGLAHHLMHARLIVHEAVP